MISRALDMVISDCGRPWPTMADNRPKIPRCRRCLVTTHFVPRDRSLILPPSWPRRYVDPGERTYDIVHSAMAPMTVPAAMPCKCLYLREGGGIFGWSLFFLWPGTPTYGRPEPPGAARGRPEPPGAARRVFRDPDYRCLNTTQNHIE